MKILTLLCLLATAAGWFSTPFIFRHLSGNCVSYTTLIYDESDRTIVSSARWDMMRGGEQFLYSSTINDIPFRGDSREFAVERTVNTRFSSHLDSLTMLTSSAFRIAGPETSDPQYGRYIDPLAEEGFTARVYAYLTGNRIMIGFRDLPISVCRN